MENSKYYSRRDLGRILFTSGIILAGVSCTERDETSNVETVDPQEVKLLASVESLQAVRDFENSYGNILINQESARNYAPLLADLFVSATSTEITPEEFIKHTIVFSSDGKEIKSDPRTAPLEELENTELISDIRSNYPDIALDEKTIRDIARQTLGSFFGFPVAFVKNDQLFLNIAQIAGMMGPTFDNLGRGIQCEIGKSVEAFRSVYLHELTHLNANLTDKSTWKAPSIEFVRRFVDEKYVIEAPESTGGFNFNALVDGKLIGISMGGYEELTAHYLAARISMDNGLRFITNAYDPHELANFEGLLKAGGIDTNELLDLHATADFEGLFNTILKAAIKPKNYKGEENWKVTAANSLRFAIDNSTPPSWSSLDDFYGDWINSERTDFWPESTAYSMEGCINPSPYFQEVTK